MNKRAYIYDLETYKDIFLACFIDIKSNQRFVFEISRRKNEFKQLEQFLRTQCGLLIGYNNLSFDYPIIHNLLSKKREEHAYYYNLANQLINKRAYPYKVQFIQQLDLFKIWHFDNPAV